MPLGQLVIYNANFFKLYTCEITKRVKGYLNVAKFELSVLKQVKSTIYIAILGNLIAFFFSHDVLSSIEVRMEMQMLNTDMDYQVGNLLIKLANICDTIQVKPKLHLN